MPALDALARQLPGKRQHLMAADRSVAEKISEPPGLFAIAAQHAQAHRSPLVHGRRQRCSGGRQTDVAKPAKLQISHANRSLPAAVWAGESQPASQQ